MRRDRRATAISESGKGAGAAAAVAGVSQRDRRRLIVVGEEVAVRSRAKRHGVVILSTKSCPSSPPMLCITLGMVTVFFPIPGARSPWKTFTTADDGVAPKARTERRFEIFFSVLR